MIGSGAALVLVAGDAGIGKSRLVAELVAGSGNHLLGSCLPLRRMRSLLPFQEMFAARNARVRVDSALGTMPAGLVECLLGILPDRVGHATRSVETGGGEGDADRVFIGIRALLTAMAASVPLLVVVEDVHWADPATLDLLTFLGSQLRDPDVTLVATFRTDDAGARSSEMLDWLSHLQRAEGAEVITLRGLARDEVAVQVASLLHHPASAATVDTVFERGEGNPFFTEQLVAALTGSDQNTDLPQRLADFLRARVRSASADGSQLLQVLAVAARPLRIRSLVDICDINELDVHRALVELVDAALVEVISGQWVRARHALLNEAVLREVPTTDRTELHRRLATVLSNSDGDLPAAEIADHWHEAGDALEEFRWAERAVDAAWSVGAWQEAAGWLQRLVALDDELGGAAALTGTSIVDLWSRAIRATDLAGDVDQALEMASVAYERYRDWPEVIERARLIRKVAHGQMVRDPRSGQATLEEVLPALEGLPPSEEYADVLLLYASAFVWQGQSQRAVPILERAVAVAEQCASAGVTTRATLKLAQALGALGESKRAADLLIRAAGVAATSGDPQSIVAAAVDGTDELLESGQLDEARRVALRALQVAREHGLEGAWGPHILVYNAAEAALEQGLTETAAELIVDLTERPVRSHVGPLDELRAEIDLRRGLVAESLARLETTPLNTSLDDLVAAGARKTWVHRWAGQPARGLDEALSTAERGAGTDTDFQSGLLAAAAGAAADLAESARARRDEQDLSRAAGAVTRLRELSAAFAGGTRPRVKKPAEHLELMAELSRANGDSNSEEWQAVADAWTGLGRPHRAAYSWWRLAQALLIKEADRAVVKEVLQHAFASSDGHAPLRDAITELAERARIRLVDRTQMEPSDDSDRAAVPVKLTDQETRVLRLVAAGMTNAEIGTELFISPKTVSVHVSNVLRKLDMHSRVQAAAWADQVGLSRPRHQDGTPTT